MSDEMSLIYAKEILADYWYYLNLYLALNWTVHDLGYWRPDSNWVAQQNDNFYYQQREMVDIVKAFSGPVDVCNKIYAISE